MKCALKILKWLSLTIIALIVLSIAYIYYLYNSADLKVPEVNIASQDYAVIDSLNFKSTKTAKIRKSDSGLDEIYLTGNGFERGYSTGALAQDYLQYQEDVFVESIYNVIPSKSYVKFLRFVIAIFNRDLASHIPLEYREELYGLSQFASTEYNDFGSAYERQLNYQAAHDIGHAMQQYMLVGCSSFVLDSTQTANKKLLVSRNFDFYFGDDFAKNKLVFFVAPNGGYKFASISWAGMVGVLSGMNEKGLTVTINAAKGDMPGFSATPISILVREILQYASNIDEAIAIASRTQTFVSEQILICSAQDKKAIIIDKTPDMQDVFYPTNYPLISTNHFQSEKLKNTEINIDNIKTTDSKYRYNRLSELLDTTNIDEKYAVSVLRNRYGLKNKDIGFTNEKSINQYLAHHSVVFQPEDLLMWVSTAPWQNGKFVCYDLKKVFSNPDFSKELYTDSLTIAADTSSYHQITQYKKMSNKIRESIKLKSKLSAKQLNYFIALNPNYYYTYKLLGDYYKNLMLDNLKANEYYIKALECEIPQLSKRIAIENLIWKN